MNVAPLRDVLIAYFSDGELRDLCFDLAIDYEGLPGQEKVGKARELVSYVERHRRTAELVARVRALRPRAAWPESAQSAPSQQPQGKPAEDRSVHIGGAVTHGVIITGDHNIINNQSDRKEH